MEAKKRDIDASKLEQIAMVLKTMSHSVRLEILQTLEVEEPLTVGEILRNISQDVEQSMLSHHLSKLKDKGILKSSKKGKYIYYSLTDRKFLKIFDCMEKCDFLH